MPPDILRTITPVILCGGAGKRLRPLSRSSIPKPFLKVNGSHTMLQQTALRVRDCAASVLVLNQAMADRARRDLAAVDIAPSKMLLEPSGRNTAPALAAAASVLPSQMLLILPSDHWMGSPEAFLAAVACALPLAQEGWIVAFGVPPSRPESGFGYIRRGPAVSKGANRIVRFCEKPSRADARTMIRNGNWDWNSGIFLAPAETMLEELQRFEPDLLAAVQKSLPVAEGGDDFLLASGFSAVPALSIDAAIMERSDKTLVIPMECDWDDLGTWAGLLRRSFPGFMRLQGRRFFV